MPEQNIVRVSQDWFLMWAYPDLARAVQEWVEWYQDPVDSPPIDTILLSQACKYALSAWVYVYKRGYT